MRSLAFVLIICFDIDMVSYAVSNELPNLVFVSEKKSHSCER